jgi:tRNA A-37 threonylcarbamoyl transferase component Bud32
MSGFRVGDRVADYELLELVGEGRMGQVYQALQPRLERVVAVKIIRPELVADERSRERFRREMRIAASIDHPSIIPVYEVDEEDGALFAAMRWVDGTDVGRLIAERGRLDPTQATRILARVASALEAAHGVGLFHRDLKPSNILLEGDRVYLTDFGLASVSESLRGEQLSALVGSVEYAAPELLDDAPPDSRTDVYALGCVLYEMLTGSVPFPPESLAVAPGVAGDAHPVPASKLRDGLPPTIDPVLRRALSSEPADRYRTPSQFVEAVEGALAGSGVEERGRRRRRRLLALGAAALVVVAAAVAVVLTSGGGDGKEPATKKATAADVGGRTLPAAATLPACGKTFTGPPRDCRSKTGGFEALADVGTPLRLATMDFTVKRVREASKLSDSNGATFTAPSGIRFVVIDATVTNLTNKTRTFEPNNLTVWGRETALWFFNDKDKIVAYRSHHGDDYSTQYATVAGTLQHPLLDVELFPHVPYSGQLVFHYPAKTLDAYHRAVLEVHELGHGFRDSKSLGGARLEVHS